MDILECLKNTEIERDKNGDISYFVEWGDWDISVKLEK